MSNRKSKPKKSARDLIEMMRDEKGITFSHMDENEAEAYLLYKNNYLRTSAYRKNYKKHPGNSADGKYVNLDFAYLAELSTIDMHLRFIALRMCIDIEHALKVQLIREIETNTVEDGYSIVRDIFEEHKYLKHNIIRKSDSPNCEGLISSSFKFASVFKRLPKGKAWMEWEILDNDCSAWTFLELCSFGDLLKFYAYYHNKYDLLSRIDDGILNSVKSIRNTCAHNNCLFFNLTEKDTTPSQIIMRFVVNTVDIGRGMRRNRLSVRPIYEFVCLLYVYSYVVTEQIKQHRLDELRELFRGRMCKHGEFFEKNEVLLSTYKFLGKIVDNLQ